MFLKFIKAEAKAIYRKVKLQLRETVMKDKCRMISEAEMLMPVSWKKVPIYLIKRETSN